MLCMLIVVYDPQSQFQTNRAALFTQFVETLLEREQLSEQRDSLCSSLKILAWAMQQQSADANRNVQTTIPRIQALQQVDEQTLVQGTRANLLDAGDDVRFSHQLLQEYFTARMMQDKLDQEQLPVHDLWPADTFWRPSGWEEATILLTGLYAPDCTAVLRWLLPAHPEYGHSAANGFCPGFTGGYMCSTKPARSAAIDGASSRGCVFGSITRVPAPDSSMAMD